MPDTLKTVLLYAAPTIVAVLFLSACALVHAAWRLWRSEDERAWWRCLRQARRARSLEEARQRGELHPLWTRGDGRSLLLLLGVTAVVIVLCR